MRPHSFQHVRSIQRRQQGQLQEQIDDDNLGRIRYDGSWRKFGGSEEFSGTTHEGTGEGATAIFEFSGTGVRVVGTVCATTDAGAATSTYKIDSQSFQPYVAPVVGTAKYSIVFFEKYNLPNGHHTLVMTQGKGSPLVLDLIETFFIDQPIVESDTPSPSPSPTPSLSSSSDSTINKPETVTTTIEPGSQTTGLQTNLSRDTSSRAASIQNDESSPSAHSESASPTAGQTGNAAPALVSDPAVVRTTSDAPSETGLTGTRTASTHSSNIPVIAGSVAGAVALIFIALLAFYCILRRRRAASKPHPDMYTVTPMPVSSIHPVLSPDAVDSRTNLTIRTSFPQPTTPSSHHTSPSRTSPDQEQGVSEYPHVHKPPLPRWDQPAEETPESPLSASDGRLRDRDRSSFVSSIAETAPPGYYR